MPRFANHFGRNTSIFLCVLATDRDKDLWAYSGTVSKTASFDERDQDEGDSHGCGLEGTQPAEYIPSPAKQQDSASAGTYKILHRACQTQKLLNLMMLDLGQDGVQHVILASPQASTGP